MCHEYTCGIVDLIVVENIVLGGCSPKPYWTLLGLNKNTTTIVQIDLLEIRTIKLMIGNPEPAVFDIDRAFCSNVKQQECCLTFWLRTGDDSRILGTSIRLAYVSN